MASELVRSLNWEKMGGLLPAVVQHTETGEVLMLGYMNREALIQTLQTGRVTFWSRSRKTLWTKGETSGHTLSLVSVQGDCDADALLILARPTGPTCHLGSRSCFGTQSQPPIAFLGRLEEIIRERRGTTSGESYTHRLFVGGEGLIAKKVGEEGIEVALSVLEEPERSVEECADLLYHLLVFLQCRGLRLEDVLSVLARRHQIASQDHPQEIS